MSHTLTPRTEPFPDEISAILEGYPKIDGFLLRLFRVFARSQRFLTKGVPNLLDAESPLCLTERELTILRVTAVLGCEYEWGVHVAVFAEAASLSAEQVSATCATSSEAPCWTEDQSLLIRAVDQLLATGRLEPKTLSRFRERWTPEQQLEIFALCGAYTTVSLVANHSDMPLEDFAARFPAQGAK